jgi:type VI secretion system secreted protein Hcp
MDKATPSLFLESCCGRGNTIELALTKTGTGSGAQAYMRYTAENAVISHYSMQASTQKTTRPVEKIIISFTSLQLQYTPFDENGLPDANIAVGFDTATNALL